MSKSLTDKTISGLNWNMLNNYVNAIVTTIVGIVLARLLEPEEFGLVGMVVIFTGLAELFSTLGMGKSVIRFKDLNDDHIKTATLITIILSIFIYTTFYAISPFISDFYNEEQLTSILRVLSVIFILQGINTVSYSQIMKKLDFKTIMLINISTSIAYGLMSSTLAVIGFGVWSLVYGRIISQSLATIMSVYKFPVKLTFKLKKKECKELIGFGSGVSLSSILFYASSNVDYLIIGKYLSPYALGLYTRAFNLMTQSISRVAGGIYNVIFPAFAAVQNNTEKLRKAYLRTIKTVSYFIFPILGIMIIDADYVIKGLYGDKWEGVIPVFRILAFGGLLKTTLSYSGAIAQATGKVYAEMFRQLIYFLILGGGSLYTVRFGIEGVAFTVVAALTWMFFAHSRMALKIIETDWKEFCKSFIPGSVNLLLMLIINSGLVFILERYYSNTPDEIKLGITVIINIIAFISIIVFVPYKIKGDTFNWLIEKYKRIIPRFFQNFYFRFNPKEINNQV